MWPFGLRKRVKALEALHACRHPAKRQLTLYGWDHRDAKGPVKGIPFHFQAPLMLCLKCKKVWGEPRITKVDGKRVRKADDKGAGTA